MRRMFLKNSKLSSGAKRRGRPIKVLILVPPTIYLCRGTSVVTVSVHAYFSVFYIYYGLCLVESARGSICRYRIISFRFDCRSKGLMLEALGALIRVFTY